MHIFFDIRTLSLFSGLISACLFISMVYIFKNRKTYPGFGQWTIAYILNFLGFSFLSLRNMLPDFVTIVLANLLITLCFVSIARGLILFAEGRQSLWVDLLPPVVLILSYLYFVYIYPNLNARIVVLSLVLIVISLRCLSICLRMMPGVLGGRNWFLAAAFVWMVITLLTRVVFTISHGPQINDFMGSSTIQGISIISGSIGLIFIAIGLIVANAQRLEKDLVTAGREIKTLRGFLPICSYCKKIRDDQGYWKQIESYIQNHSDASFSHGICPECLDRLYGDKDWYKDMKKKKRDS